jgi:hypothetical protein
MLNEFFNEMIRRGKVMGYHKESLEFAAGYMHDAERNLNLKSNRKADPAALAEEAKWIFQQNPFVQVIIWFDDYSWFAKAERERPGNIHHSGKEYSFLANS